jgi:hypothetical protein
VRTGDNVRVLDAGEILVASMIAFVLAAGAMYASSLFPESVVPRYLLGGLGLASCVTGWVLLFKGANTR